MITTVTTTTVTTVTTITAASLALIAILTLLALLITKEVMSNSTNSQIRRFSKTLNVAIVPLLLVFAMAAFTQVVTVLTA